jgi:hypothetical protein
LDLRIVNRFEAHRLYDSLEVLLEGRKSLALMLQETFFKPFLRGVVEISIEGFVRIKAGN